MPQIDPKLMGARIGSLASGNNHSKAAHSRDEMS
jgi:hypothetical protein